MALTQSDYQALREAAVIRQAINRPQLPPVGGYGQAPVNVIPGLGQPIAAPQTLGQPLALNPAPTPIEMGSAPTPRTPYGSMRGPRMGSLYTPMPGTPAAGPSIPGLGQTAAAMPADDLMGQSLANAIRSSTGGTGAGGIYGTGIGAQLAQKPVIGRALGLQPSSGLGNIVKGGGAAIAGQGIRDRILFGGDKVLTTDDAASRFADTMTQGAVAGIPFGGPVGSAVGAAGMGLGQLGTDAIAAVGRTDNSLLEGLMGVGGMNIANELAGRDGEGLSVTRALGNLEIGNRNLGQMFGGNPGAPVDNTGPAIEAYNRVVGDAQKAETDAAMQILDPATLSSIAQEMGATPAATQRLASEWETEVKRMKVLSDRGLLTVDVPTEEKDADGNPVTKTVKVDEKLFPHYMKSVFDEMVVGLPDIIGQLVDQETAAAQAQFFDAVAKQDAMARAYGAAQAIQQSFGGQMAAMQGNSYMAPFAGMVGAGMTALPYQFALAQEASVQDRIAGERAQIAQQEAAQQRAYNQRMNELAAQDAYAAAKKAAGGGAEDAIPGLG